MVSEQPESTPSGPRRAEGWWEQAGFGRQPMRELTIAIRDGRLTGAGIDVVGRFDLGGTLAGEGTLILMKRYAGRHTVTYAGWHDGEGRLWGHWRLQAFSGRWMITSARDPAAADDDLVGVVTLSPRDADAG
jgi:hypothetical protein